MINEKLIKKILPLLCALALAGCGGNVPEAVDTVVAEVSIREAVTEADPDSVIKEIYEGLPKARVQPLTPGRFNDLLSGLDGMVEQYYGCVSDPSGGLADVLILQPKEGVKEKNKSSRDLVREALRLYQEQRMREFENYDILDAFSIAKDAEVFDQGDYVILLMLPDNETAREIIDRHIPM